MLTRRRFLAHASGFAAASALAPAFADSPIQFSKPRATSGDRAAEPDWKERLTITVGPKDADIVGANEKAVQAAVEYMARYGGGTVRLLPGTYKFRNAVYLASGVRILGSGDDSVVVKEPSTRVKLVEDSDWYDQEVTLANADGFRVGDGVCFQAKNPHHSGTTTIKRTLVARDGNRFKLDRALRENLWVAGEPTAATLFPLFSGENIERIAIEEITLDGNRKNNELLDGNHAGCVWLQDCQQATFRRVTARNYHGDGLSWQVCHDVLVEHCHSHDHANLGLHPGSGSQRPIIRHNVVERCGIGLFWCWGVKFGLAEHNRIVDIRDFGISIGHNDTDNVMRHNEVLRSGKVGVLFRDDNRGKDFWANRNLVEQNKIVDTGGDAGIAIDVQGQTKDVVLRNNELRETRQPMQRIGIRVGNAAKNIQIVHNRIEGFSQSLKDLRTVG